MTGTSFPAMGCGGLFWPASRCGLKAGKCCVACLRSPLVGCKSASLADWKWRPPSSLRASLFTDGVTWPMSLQFMPGEKISKDGSSSGWEFSMRVEGLTPLNGSRSVMVPGEVEDGTAFASPSNFSSRALFICKITSSIRARCRRVARLRRVKGFFRFQNIETLQGTIFVEVARESALRFAHLVGRECALAHYFAFRVDGCCHGRGSRLHGCFHCVILRRIHQNCDRRNLGDRIASSGRTLP